MLVCAMGKTENSNDGLLAVSVIGHAYAQFSYRHLTDHLAPSRLAPDSTNYSASHASLWHHGPSWT